jgi:ABC-2 type transport system ATP-binding protein
MKIELDGLTKTYHGNVQGVNLSVETGMFGLLGPNGAGKTTLMRILSGILKLSDGKAMINGHDLRIETGRIAVKRILGYLPQELGLYPDLSAREFLDYMGLLKGLTNKKQSVSL